MNLIFYIKLEVRLFVESGAVADRGWIEDLRVEVVREVEERGVGVGERVRDN